MSAEDETGIKGPYFSDTPSSPMNWDCDVDKRRHVNQAWVDVAYIRMAKAALFQRALARLMAETYEQLQDREEREINGLK